MTEFVKYLLESSLCMAVFYFLYRILLAGDTFIVRNRFYLLFTVLVSFLIPGFSFSIHQPEFNFVNQFNWNPVHDIGVGMMNETEIINSNSDFRLDTIVLFLYLSGVMISWIRILKHLLEILKIIYANEIVIKDNLKIVSVKEITSPYSFFRYVFLNPNLYSESNQKQILLHESVHVRQLHTADLILVELVTVLMWFNPFIYLIRISLAETHEYLADRGCLQLGADKIEYQNALVQNIESRMALFFTSAFNSSITLKRIKMIKKIKSSGYKHFKILMIVPVLFVAVVSFGFIKPMPKMLEGNFEAYHSTKKYQFPIESGENVRITAVYGKRMHPIHKKEIFHKGVDIAAPTGTPVHAVADGVVQKVNLKFTKGKGYGRFIILNHENGLSSLYSQMNSYSVKEGQQVKKGDVVGTVGSSGISTGPHLHMELKKDGKHVDPLTYLNPNPIK